MLPARLTYAWYFSVKRKIAYTETAQTELTVICSRPSTTGAAIILTSREFWFTLLLNFEG